MPARPIMARTLARATSTLVVVLTSSACTSWRSHTTNPGAVIAAEQPGRVRVALVDDTRLEMRHPQVHGDSLIGYVPEEGRLVTVPLADTRGIQIAATRWWVIAGIGIGVVWVVSQPILFFWGCSSGGCT